jgi:carboxypeptidase C (cathepsin A)
MKKIIGILLTAVAVNFSLAADEPPPHHFHGPGPAAGSGDAPKQDDAKNDAATIPDASHKPVFTTNTVTIAGESVKYVAEAGMLPILKEDGTTRASIFYIAYTRIGETNTAKRPITFSFNGGPGSASLWLHLGALGPRRVKMNPDGTLPPPPFSLVDNDYSLLGASDLVFIDPVATGFSRAAKDEKPEDFFGDRNDLESVSEFIRLWTTRHDRWLSPKFLCGESYGVFRAAGLADRLRENYGMYLNGLILVSGVLDYATLENPPGNDLPYILYMPAYTAAAHYHNKLPPDLQNDLEKALAEARTFAKGEFASALQKGDSLPADERTNVINELARLTGLKPQVIIDNNLRIDEETFRKQLLHDEGLILGRYDSRITARDGDPASPVPDFDPSDAAVSGPFSAAMNHYVRSELKFEDDLPYALVAQVRPWNFEDRDSYPNAGDKLASTMNQNPYMKVLVLGGRCDLACPIDTVHYAIDHMALDPNYRTNITYVQFDAGHMMYINLPDLKKLQPVLQNFIKL